jgi:hypothetical protein
MDPGHIDRLHKMCQELTQSGISAFPSPSASNHGSMHCMFHELQDAREPADIDAGKTTQRSWLLLIYRIPAERSSARSTIWREVRRLGALSCSTPYFFCHCRTRIARHMTAYHDGLRSTEAKPRSLRRSHRLRDGTRELSNGSTPRGTKSMTRSSTRPSAFGRRSRENDARGNSPCRTGR